MKIHLNQLLTIAVLIIVGCSGPCKDVVCGPGTCDDGTCICPEGYEGNFCEILVNEKYFGLYSVTESDCTNGALLFGYKLSVETKSDGGATDAVFVFSNPFGSGVNFKGTIKNGKLDASTDLSGQIVTLTGEFIDSNTFEGSYIVVGDGKCDFTSVS